MLSRLRSTLRVHRSSFLGSFLIVVLAAGLLSATGVWLESGLRGGAGGQSAPLLTTVASSFAGTTLVVVVLVVSSTFAAALRQRHRQFALLRAVGATTGQVRSMVTAEVLAVTALAAPIGAVLGLFAARLPTALLTAGGIVPAGFAPVITPFPVLAALALLLPAAVIAARLAARSTNRLSPMEAIRGRAAESPRLSRGRRNTAVVLLAIGLLVAATPLFVSGAVGGAGGATSALLLITAAALAGPALVGWAATAGSRAASAGRPGPTVLAWANARGFSRRLTAAVIPLALVLALGTVQTGANQGLVEAAGQQLQAGLDADLVATHSGDGAEAPGVTSVPGVEASMASSVVPLQTKVEDDDEDLALFNGLFWESSIVRTITADAEQFIDPAVSRGSLAGLAARGTIAVSGDALLGTGKGVGDTIELRFGDGSERSVTIAAIYDRGLAFGDFIIGEKTLPATERPAHPDALFLRTEPGRTGAVGAALAADGLDSTDTAGYARMAMDSGAAQQRLSSMLSLVLVLFLVLAAVNSLVMLTVSRRPELEVLARVGATRGQLRRMVGSESVFVAVAALLIGTAAVLPALLGIGVGLLGQPGPAVDWPAYGALVGVVVVTATVTMAGAGWSATRIRGNQTTGLPSAAPG